MTFPQMKRAYSAGHFGLYFDGSTTPGYVKSIEGGFAKANTMAEPVGTDNQQIKHTSTREIEPFTAELGLADCRDAMTWIRDSWRKQSSRRSGRIVHGDFNMFEQLEHEFREALIMEAGFPALEGGAGRESSYLRLKFLPEAVVSKRSGTSSRIVTPLAPQQKQWLNSAFRFSLEGLDMSKVNKIDAFTIKQGVRTLHTGRELYPEIEPTKIEFPDLTVYMALEYADSVMRWYEQFVRTGKRDPRSERTGSIEYLHPDRTGVNFRINLYEVGLKSFNIIKSDGMGDAIKRAKFELYVGKMDVDLGSGFA